MLMRPSIYVLTPRTPDRGITGGITSQPDARFETEDPGCALFLFNIGQAYKRAGRPKEALAAYERFLRADPQSTLRAEAEGYCNDMRSLIAEQERSAQVKAALLTEKERAAEKEAALRVEQQRTEQTQKALQAERAKAERERRRPIYKRPWFWGVLGGGVVAAGLAIGLGVALAPRDRETEGGFVDINFALSR